MRKKSDRAKAKEKAWNAFSRYIRVKYAETDGLCKCVTCGVKLPWKKLQAGHFIDSRCNAVLFNEDIVYPQCYSCNIHKNGNKVMYTLFMLKKHTKKKIEEFTNLKNKTLKISIPDLIELKEMYEGKAESLIAEKELNQ